MDERYRHLAERLVGYSIDLKPGEIVLIEATETPPAFVRALVEAVAERDGVPTVWLKDLSVLRAQLLAGKRATFELTGDNELACMKQVQAYIGVRGAKNSAELCDVPHENLRLWEDLVWKRVHVEQRVPHTKWVVLRWPLPSMAQQAKMSTEAFEDFYFQVCTLDYERLSRAMEPLKERMERADEVYLRAPGTDLRFSIREIPVVLCDGHRNIPDGEVYTAPVRESVEGVIRFNAPTVYQGVTHEDVCLEFEKGRIVRAESSNSAHLNRVLDTDEGARYVGEFAVGLNPHIRRPMGDILFDEKIAGSIHLTPGNAYQEAFNGNRSAVHWDLVLLMDPSSGGGEVYFDGELIRRDGRFVPPDLQALNPEALLA
ncbi:MAG TPA: aminopeptidase [Acidobacteriota bacterium]|nr:aminopeptidase [Acidobacteriota bacterium]HRR25624.1 aminopeptidase [Acidobacteriota bacterium]HRR55988.1 aminopeptidase [Acidobacteriota bacterium]HRV07759.1 aminopeptidase [Acidobacteriota bacterium]